ncbi:uncharacterized protein LOC128307492 [Anopheles moucheti]|uniref:uncharacterized protein LOC128307491 n=1 Tax=Anopheles moucheti TaxID=186751 RepID=UPI0022F0EE05|nr:uncharacterized protein LOC128307491 [Anopheles moucheti]XP_052901333.1 uncharacterized protein LOC128307492 [Anopheles moucheti]
MEETNRSRTEARSVLQGGSPEEMHTDLDGQENILRQNMDTEETRTIASPMLQPIISSVSNGHEDILSDDQDYSEQDESFEQISDDLSFREELRSWALSTNQTHHALNSLLEILHKKTDFPLPKDARTLMRTPTNTAACISTIEGGRFWYHGISNCLQEYFR